LAKFEHAWLGLPHLVCLGAEKNFIRFAERLTLEGDPVVDQNYFQQVVAKAILWRTTERLFDATKLPQWRAQTVAYSVAWLGAESGQRIDLDKVWRDQRLTEATCSALSAICIEAHEHISSQAGNPGEAAKKEPCWQAFRTKKLSVPAGWKEELSEHRYLPATTEDEALGGSWEQSRIKFIDDARTVDTLESLTGRSWPEIPPGTRARPISFYAGKSWTELRRLPRLRLRTLRALAEILAQLSRH